MGLKILMLSWEYPPEHVGGLGRHVFHLSSALAEKGAEVTVLTRGTRLRGEEKGGLKRVIACTPYSLNPPDFLSWALEFNISLLETWQKVLSKERFDVIHAHDWIVTFAARAIKHSCGLPLCATIHATEFGRQKGLHTPHQHHISEAEWWLCYEAWRVIACSHFMKDEIAQVFNVPCDKIRVIPNGIDVSWFKIQRKPDPTPLILFVGRLVPEKGPQTVIEAMSDILEEFPWARLVIAGQGPMEGELRTMVHRWGLTQVVDFLGHQDDSGLKELYSRAWVSVFPSSYEPFGIVALESMASGVPCVVGDTGGFHEIIDHGYTGVKVEPQSPKAIAEAVKSLFRDVRKRDFLSSNAKESCRVLYSWADIADQTLRVYEEITARKSAPEKEALAAGGLEGTWMGAR